MADGGADDPVKKALEQKQFLTTRISDTVRTLCLGVLALVYGIVSSDSAYAQGTRNAHLLAIKTAGIGAISALVLDYLQYLFGRLSVAHALRRKDAPGRYDSAALSYRLRGYAFWGKQVTGLLAVAMVVWIFAASF